MWSAKPCPEEVGELTCRLDEFMSRHNKATNTAFRRFVRAASPAFLRILKIFSRSINKTVDNRCNICEDIAGGRLDRRWIFDNKRDKSGK